MLRAGIGAWASRRGGSQRACQSEAEGASRCQRVDIAQDACTLPLLYLAFYPTDSA